MNAIYETVNLLGIRFIDFAVPMLVQSSLLILILLFIDTLLRKKVHAVFRYWIWMVVLLKLVLPTSLSSPVSLGRWLGNKLPYLEINQRIAEPHIEREIMPPAPAAVTLSTNSASVETNVNPTASPRVPIASADTVVPEEESVPVVHKPKAPTPKPIAKLSWQGVLFLLWLAVVIAIGMLLLQRATVVRCLVAQAKEVDDSMANLLVDCCKHMRIKGTVGMKALVNTTSPAVCGLFRPVVLIPKNIATSLSSIQLQVVFLHELAHIKRRDLWVNLAQTILQILYFYNPLLWLANAIIRRVREQAVDETVLVAVGKNAMQYPQTLLEVARLAFRRPVMSLRLIGVAESRDALTVRIKRILSRPIPKTAKLRILSLLVIIITAAILLPMGKAMQPKPFVVNKGPLDIRLVGVCPDGGRQIYDASGRKLKATMGALGAFHTYWKDEDKCRDFLFEVPDVNSQVVFLPFIHMYIAGTKLGLGGGRVGYFDPTDNPFNFIYSTTFARTYRKDVLSIPHKKRIQNVDLTLRYLYGPRGQDTCTFTGPFKMNQTVVADGAKSYNLTFQEGITIEGSGIMLRFETSEPFDRETPAILYDLNGRRYMLDEAHGSRSGGKTNLQYHGVVVLPEKIAAITFGEKPHEITFKNVAVDYPDRPHRTHAEFLDEMAKRFDLTNTSSEYLAQYSFKNPTEAIDVIDIVRGDWHVRQVYEAIQHGKTKIDITKLDQATQEKIHQAVTEWAKTNYLAKYGISLGLMGQWPEFIDIAIEKLGREIPQSSRPFYERNRRDEKSDIAHAMIKYGMDQLTDEQVRKIKELILKTDIDSVLQYLISYLNRIKSQVTTDALWELAQSDKPWIWWQATEAWYYRTSRTRQVYDDLSEKMKVRLILVKGKIKDEILEEKALKLLPEIFSSELGRMSSRAWSKIREKILLEFDKKAATKIFVNYLRQLQSDMTTSQSIIDNTFKGNPMWMAVCIIRNLNVWYGTNIGKLGTDETSDTDIYTLIRTQIEFQSLISEALQWCDNNRDAVPVELPFAGKVVDTAGKPIAGAELHFTRIEVNKDEQGDQSQRSVNIGQCRTDTNGGFSFEIVEDGRDCILLFDVTADGYVPKEEIHIQRLIDGRYRYNVNAAPVDTVIVLQSL